MSAAKKFGIIFSFLFSLTFLACATPPPFHHTKRGSLEPISRTHASGFAWPVEAVAITSPFGQRGQDFHEGIDLKAATGTPVYASKAGVVLYAGTRIRGYGKLVVIRHAGNIATIYAHNSRLLVRRGQRVRQGQRVAISGATGRVSGPHVHFEIRKGYSALNPAYFLPQLKRSLASNSKKDARVAALRNRF